MKKTVFLVVLFSVMFSLNALTVRAGLGVVSAAGVTFQTGNWDFDAEIHSVFPMLTTVGPKVLPEVVRKDAGTDQWREFCRGLFNGAGAGASYRFLNTGHHSLSIGLGISSGIVNDGKDGLDLLSKYEQGLLTLLSVQMRYSFSIDGSNGLYFSFGYPFAAYMRIFGVPGDNDAYGINMWLLIPESLMELEKNRDIPDLARLGTLGLIAATVRIGYAYTF